MQWTRENFVLTDEAPLDAVDDTYQLLQTTYWAEYRPLPIVEQAIENSLCFFLLLDKKQLGFGRVITDFATTSWIADVVLDESCQRIGVGSWMMQCVIDHPKLKHTQFVLQTGSAHNFYQRLGFSKNNALMSTVVSYLP